MTINWSFFSPFALVMIPSKDVCDPNAIRFPLNISKHIVSCPPGLAHCQGLSRLLGLLRSSLWSTVSQQIGGSMGKLHGCFHGNSMDVGKQRPSVSRAQAVWCQCGALGLLAPKEPYVLAASTGRSWRRALHSKFPILLCCNFKLNRPADHNSEVFNILIIYHITYIYISLYIHIHNTYHYTHIYICKTYIYTYIYIYM